MCLGIVFKTEKGGALWHKVTSCIKYKGLESDAIVVIGLDKESFVGEKGLEFYVGTSRAKLYLDFIAKIAPEDYVTVVGELNPDAPQIRNNPEAMKEILAEVFSAEVVNL